MKAIHVVEAALFSAGRAVSIQEICDETGLNKSAVRQAVDDLRKQYAGRDTVLEIGKAGAKWAMQVSKQAADPAAKFAQMEIAPKLLKTLALIAYHQPVKQSDVFDMVGSRVYDHVPELKERGLIKTRKDGQTKIITTTQAFPEYFGLDAASPDEIRAAMAKLVGLPPPEKKQKETGLGAFTGDPETAVPDTSDAPEAVEKTPTEDSAGPQDSDPARPATGIGEGKGDRDDAQGEAEPEPVAA